MKFKNVKILSFVLVILTVFMFLPSKSVTAHAVGETAQINTYDDGNMVVSPTFAYGTEVYTEIETELETEVYSGESEGGDLNLVAPPLTQIGPPPLDLNDTTTIPNGVYALKNVGNANAWMNVEGGSIYPDAHMCQILSTISPVNSFDRSCLFKITKVANADRYIIRSMVNNRLTFGFDNHGYIMTKEIPPNDAEVAIADTFVFECNSATGYIVIKPYGSGNYCVAPNRNVESGAYLLKKTTVSAPNQIYWQMYQYTGEAKSGISLPVTPRDLSYGVKVGETFTISLKTWSTVIGANTPYITVHPEYQDMAHYSMNESNYSITVTPLKEGPLGIRAVIRYDGTQTAMLMYRPMWTVIPEIDGETAVIKNVGTKKYIDLELVDYTPTGIVQQWDYHTGNQAQWVFEVSYGGFFNIKSVKSGMYVGIDPSNNASVKQYATKSDYTIWRLKRTSSGNFTFSAYLTESSGVVLAPPSSTSGNGADLTMLTYTDDADYRDEWRIFPIRYTLEVNNYYDQGYYVRFSNNNQNPESSIILYQRGVAERFARIFSLKIVPTYGQYLSSADSCKILAHGSVEFDNLAENCSHSPTHLTTAILRNDLSNGTQIRSVIIWTGHILTGNPRSNSSSTRYSIVITPYIVTNEDEGHTNKPVAIVTMESIYTLTHETSHQLGAPDHYCYDKDNTPCRNPHCDVCVYGFDTPRSCIMSYRYDLSTITDEDMYCSECEAAINAHLEDHH